jgi:phosphopantothenoylcysteine decarboxylase/phosphopantothenate--cysteine ligase
LFKKNMKRTIILGVTGSISAYKACELTRLFVKAGDDVHVVMTQNASKFVTPLTFLTLSRNPVGLDGFEPMEIWKPSHISLATKADVIVIAPATANVIGKIANGIADDLLTNVAIAAKVPIVIAPAMNTAMWENPATQENVKKLSSRGVYFVDTQEGELACGVKGSGRMASGEAILAVVDKALSEKKD